MTMRDFAKLMAICCLFAPMLTGCVRAQTVAPWHFHDVRVDTEDGLDVSDLKYHVDRIHLVSAPGAPHENKLIDRALRDMLGHVTRRDPNVTVEVDTVEFTFGDAIRVIPLGNLGSIDVYVDNQSDHHLTVNKIWIEIWEVDEETGATTRRIPWCSSLFLRPYPEPPYYLEIPDGGQAYIMEPGEQVWCSRGCNDTKDASVLIVSISSDAIPGTLLIEFDCENPFGK